MYFLSLNGISEVCSSASQFWEFWKQTEKKLNCYTVPVLAWIDPWPRHPLTRSPLHFSSPAPPSNILTLPLFLALPQLPHFPSSPLIRLSFSSRNPPLPKLRSSNPPPSPSIWSSPAHITSVSPSTPPARPSFISLPPSPPPSSGDGMTLRTTGPSRQGSPKGRWLQPSDCRLCNANYCGGAREKTKQRREEGWRERKKHVHARFAIHYHTKQAGGASPNQLVAQQKTLQGRTCLQSGMCLHKLGPSSSNKQWQGVLLCLSSLSRCQHLTFPARLGFILY